MLEKRILKMNQPVFWVALLLAALSLALAACGGGDDDTGFTFTPSGDATDAPTDTPATADDAATPESATATTAADGDPMDGPGDMPTRFDLTAGDNFFDVDVIEAPANTEISAELFNDGVLPHNIAFLTKEGGVPLSNDAQGSIILEGETTIVTFTTPGPGTYFFNCTVHPLEMKGTFIVK